jgi:hypothetical protein
MLVQQEQKRCRANDVCKVNPSKLPTRDCRDEFTQGSRNRIAIQDFFSYKFLYISEGVGTRANKIGDFATLSLD